MTYRIAALAAALLLSAGLIAAIEGSSSSRASVGPFAGCRMESGYDVCPTNKPPSAPPCERLMAGPYCQTMVIPSAGQHWLQPDPPCTPEWLAKAPLMCDWPVQPGDVGWGPDWMATIKPAMEQASALTSAEKALQALAPVDPSPLGK